MSTNRLRIATVAFSALLFSILFFAILENAKVSERARREVAEAKTKALTDAFKLLNIPGCVVLMSPQRDGSHYDLTITHWTVGAERMFGFSPAEAIGQDAAELLIPFQMLPRHHAGLGAKLEAIKSAREAGNNSIKMNSQAVRCRANTRDGKGVETLVITQQTSEPLDRLTLAVLFLDMTNMTLIDAKQPSND